MFSVYLTENFAENLFERVPEVPRKEGVDEGVDCTVAVAEPTRYYVDLKWMVQRHKDVYQN